METGVRIYNVEPLMEKGHLGEGEIKYNSCKIWQHNRIELIELWRAHYLQHLSKEVKFVSGMIF